MVFLVEPLKEGKHRLTFPFSQDVPQPTTGSFRTLICGATGTGKSTILVRLLQQYMLPYGKNSGVKTGRRFFSKIVLFSPNQKQYEANLDWGEHDWRYEDYEPKDMVKHYNRHVTRNKKRMKEHGPYVEPGYMLFVFDDVITDVNMSDHFTRILVNGRKEGVSIIITSQKYAIAGSSTDRQNFSHIVLTSTSTSELKLIARYIQKREKTVERLWHENIQDKYDFLYFRVMPKPVMISLGFNRQVLEGKPKSKLVGRKGKSRQADEQIEEEDGMDAATEKLHDLTG
mgnify:CR=1 FL=1